MKTDLHLTWVSNCKEWDRLAYSVCFKSLRKFADYPSIILTNDLDGDAAAFFRECGSFPLPINSIWNDPPEIQEIFRDRWLAFWKYIDPTAHDYVVITDSRDVVFQRDPVQFLRRVAGDRVVLTSEGFRHSDSPWNLIEQFKAQQNIHDFDIPHANWPVVNAGIVAGPAEKVKQLAFMVWSNCIRCYAPVTDQAVYNYLCHYLQKDKHTYYLANPNLDVWCVTGEALKENLMNIDVVYQDGVLKKGDTPYHIFHQWDRTKYAEDILQKYAN